MDKGSRLPILLLALGLIGATWADDGLLYRWTDAQGQVHFGDQPPTSDHSSAQRFAAPRYQPPEQSPKDDPYSILNQAKRLEEARQRLEQERQAERERQREYRLRERELAERQAPTAEPPASAVIAYPRPAYPYRPRFRPHQVPQPPGSLWEPDHPAYRVPAPYPAPPVYGREGMGPRR
ncbi:MAG: DUF4124 domain-containing protein [Chromatiaceae bacterium]|nr:DUF4124 domain-containing protein [Gammaproteobacteria bacterium]MCP5306442.1 DUF4124 domain-containing protein [Chromatiaceae bacterium]